MIAAFLLSMSVHASYISEKVTAAELSNACTSERRDAKDACKAFIVTGANSLQGFDWYPHEICPPAGASYEQFRMVFLNYLAVHLAERGRPAINVIIEANEAAFGCHGLR